MRNLVSYIGVEWKLMFRGIGIWVIAAIIGAVFYFLATDTVYASNVGASVMRMMMCLFPLFIAVFFLAMHAARREAASKNHLLFPSLPFRTWQITAARLLALAIPFTLIELMPALIYAVTAINEGLSTKELINGILVLISGAIPGWFVIVLGYLIGSLSKKRWVYLMGIVIFIGLTYGVDIFLTKHAPYLGILEFTQLDFYTSANSSVAFSSVWGFTSDVTYWYHRLFYVGFIVMISYLFIQKIARKRQEIQFSRSFYISLSVISVLLVSSLWAYISIWKEREQSFKAEVAYYKGAKTDELTSTFEGLSASDYELNVKISPEHQMEVEARFKLTNSTGKKLERIPLTLRHSFKVENAWINDVKMNAASGDQKDVIWITPMNALENGENITIKIVYKGLVDEWRTNNGSHTLAHYDGIDAGRVYLLGMFGWYPIGGIHPLTSLMAYSGYDVDKLQDHTFTIPPTNFKVTVTTSYPIALYSNGSVLEQKMNKTVFEAKNADGFSIVGGALDQVTHKSGQHTVSLIAGNQMKDEQMQKAITQIADSLERFLNEVKAIWGNEIKDPFQLYEVFMLADSNDPLKNTINIGTAMGGEKIISIFANINGIKFPYTFISLEYLQDAQNQLNHLFFQHYFAGQPGTYSGEFSVLFSAYIADKSTGVKEDLIDPLAYGFKGQPNETYVYINQIYKASSKEEFRSFIREFYTEASKERLTYEQAQQEILAYLKKRAGDIHA
ncbi:hypothetical protein EHS13_11995 [Paenibacillus psychroresistens]|uniref:Uncharacterized protein n=1 Tax=Paenibacillus psychroresistens TaxID=1778678 RepID=A0A6B8RH79_9BACL|nr:hypothetical protein [Paenibacillus psychroresistens]QGQ95550.1 hypothetical protein EHS13_11995 [Paenibacillus psychroresistens]